MPGDFHLLRVAGKLFGRHDNETHRLVQKAIAEDAPNDVVGHTGEGGHWVREADLTDEQKAQLANASTNIAQSKATAPPPSDDKTPD